MTEYVYGLLHGVDETKRIIAIKIDNKIRFFYLAKGQFTVFMAYFKPNIYVFMTVAETPRHYRGYKVQNVINIEKVMLPNKQKPTVFYDISIIRSGIKTIVDSGKPKLFVDFEMSMPPYRDYRTFVSEIIQAGLVLCDGDGKVLENHSFFIKPQLFPKISERTGKFLHIRQEDVDSGREYREFHSLFMKIQASYHPMVFVWGKNDKIELKKANERLGLTEFTQRAQFIDLLQLHKIYFNLKNDLGLFNAYNLYSDHDLDKQAHDAFEDASVTKDVFYWFKDTVNGNREITIPENGKPAE
ncbi:MAG TPA: exonuclease domain-containing protein [Candidatus Izemoplasmatales bacterium]|nr:exonuclease domain-containing protein [Candidatus Izemoplasmatales bacterium]